MSLLGKIAVVTGGAKGIGYACCEALGRAGAAVMVADIDQAAIDSAVSKLSAAGVQTAGAVCDVSKGEQVQGMVAEAVEKLGGIDIMVANAGEGRLPLGGWPLRLPAASRVARGGAARPRLHRRTAPRTRLDRFPCSGTPAAVNHLPGAFLTAWTPPNPQASSGRRHFWK